MSDKGNRDEEAHLAQPREVAPADLGEYGSQYIEALWEDLYLRSHTAEDWNASIAALVHHARHLSPEDRAKLAEAIRTPVKFRRGAPAKAARREDIWFRYHFLGRPKHLATAREAIEEIARDYNLDQEAAKKAYYQAKRDPFVSVE